MTRRAGVVPNFWHNSSVVAGNGDKSVCLTGPPFRWPLCGGSTPHFRSGIAMTFLARFRFMPPRVSVDVRSRVQSMTSPQSVRNRDRSQSVAAQCPRSIRCGVRAASAEASAQHPVNHPGNYRATAETCFGNWRDTSRQPPMNIRAQVRTNVGTMVRR